MSDAKRLQRCSSRRYTVRPSCRLGVTRPCEESAAKRASLEMHERRWPPAVIAARMPPRCRRYSHARQQCARQRRRTMRNGVWSRHVTPILPSCSSRRVNVTARICSCVGSNCVWGMGLVPVQAHMPNGGHACPVPLVMVGVVPSRSLSGRPTLSGFLRPGGAWSVACCLPYAPESIYHLSCLPCARETRL